MAGKKKHPILKVVLGIFVVLILLGALGSGAGKKDAANSSEPAPVEEVAETPAEESVSGEEPAEEPASTETPAEESTEEPVAETPADGISPELKAFLESYEAFMDEYCSFMETYNSSDAAALLKYSALMAKYADFSVKADEWNSREMNDAETLYYIQVMNRINEKLLMVSSGL